ncbi:hypothetical protein D3C80_694710 [compost metagenome]
MDVIGRGPNHDGAGGLARVDGNDRAVAQGHGHRRAGRVGQGRGVGDLAAFGDVAGGRQGQPGVVHGIGDGGHGWRGVRHQVLEIAARGASDGGADGAAVVIDVIGRGRHVHGAAGLASGDSDGRTVGQSDGYWRLCWIGQGRGVGNLTAFGDGVAGRQGDRGGVEGIGDLGRGRGSRRRHSNAAAAAGAGDSYIDLGRVVIDSVVRSQWHVDCAGGRACGNHDHGAVG